MPRYPKQCLHVILLERFVSVISPITKRVSMAVMLYTPIQEISDRISAGHDYPDLGSSQLS
jgi:hypothetical protein